MINRPEMIADSGTSAEPNPTTSPTLVTMADVAPKLTRGSRRVLSFGVTAFPVRLADAKSRHLQDASALAGLFSLGFPDKLAVDRATIPWDYAQ
jgi:hypothetical protein